MINLPQLNKLSVFIQCVWSGRDFPGTYKTSTTKNTNSESATLDSKLCLRDDKNAAFV